ncbi:MAG TPA: SDR family oxidoreductase [Candidatus Baltobacteraceae bacterium]|jgi:UDP-N-acetylglucosamine 4-epimerase|nr:SDR family oxidoreductase [Candidatus Baltobacteraceae bacterium]
MTTFEKLKGSLTASPATWLVTGAAGFIGSNLLETLLRLDQKVIALDNLSTGHLDNLNQVRQLIGPARWKKCKWIEGDIRDAALCRRATRGVDYVLHQAALGSVPRSIEDPLATHESNVSGSVNILWAAREHGVKRFVFASSSSVYGDEASLPQVEHRIGHCLSPYAVSKRVNELYADVFGKCYGFESIGLRYFNVFGPRQDPNGAYAAVIPKWIDAMIQNQPVFINGDGSTSRDFCYVANVVQANLLAATVQKTGAVSQQYNIAVGAQTSLNALHEMIRERLAAAHPHLRKFKPSYRDFRQGDILHSQADIGKARRLLGYGPTHSIAQGLDEALDWYIHNRGPARNGSSSPAGASKTRQNSRAPLT